MQNMPESLAALLSGNDKEQAETLIHPLAQAEMLREAYGQLTAVRPLPEPGQLCRALPMFSRFKSQYRTVYLVIRRLTDSEFDRALLREWMREYKTNLTALQPDLVCADVALNDGNAIAFSLHAAATLEVVGAIALGDWPLPVKPEE